MSHSIKNEILKMISNVYRSLITLFLLFKLSYFSIKRKLRLLKDGGVYAVVDCINSESVKKFVIPAIFNW